MFILLRTSGQHTQLSLSNIILVCVRDWANHLSSKLHGSKHWVLILSLLARPGSEGEAHDISVQIVDKEIPIFYASRITPMNEKSTLNIGL